MNTAYQHGEEWTRVFAAWDRAWRGSALFDIAVELEPAFAQSLLQPPRAVPIPDDARTAGGLGGLIFRNKVHQGSGPCSPTPAPQVEILPRPYYREEAVAEIEIQLPYDLETGPDVSEQVLLSIGHFRDPVAFEVFGDHGSVSLQLACSTSFSKHLTTQAKAILPEICTFRRDGFLAGRFEHATPCVLIDFGLSNSFVLSLRRFRSFDPDPLSALVGALASLERDERAALQVMFVPVRSAWSDALNGVIGDPEQRKTLNELSPNLTSAVRDKLASPLFAVSIRLIGQAPAIDGCWRIVKEVGGSLRQFNHPAGNELIALSPDGYPTNNHRLSFFSRTNYRTGMLLSATELAGLVHLPSRSVVCAKLRRPGQRTKSLTGTLIPNQPMLRLGQNQHAGETDAVTLTADQLTRHMFVVGGSGGGKSLFLCNCVRQIAEAGFGCAVVDPAGDLIQDIVSVLPENRLNDVILFDASDAEYPVGFNPLDARSEAERYLLSSDLVSLFKRYSTAWGSLMEAAVTHAINAFIYNGRGGTLRDLKRFLTEKNFRRETLQTVEDESVRYFWENEASGINAKSIGSVLIRLDGFLRHALIRNIVCQRRSKLNFREVVDGAKILLIKVSQGLIGQENAALLGSLLISKIYQTALTRQDLDLSQRRPFFVFADEVQNYLTESLGMILAGTRKYGVGLTLATQSLQVLQKRDPELAESILANCLTRICFRLSDDDARRLAQGFSYFSAEDLQKLGVGEAICRIERADQDFNLKTLPPRLVPEDERRRRLAYIAARSRRQYAVSRNSAEADVRPSRDPQSEPVIGTDPRLNLPLESKKEKTPLASRIGQAGPHHRDIQSVIRRIAESHGFEATIEENILGGFGRVDVSIRTSELRIACEVSVSTVNYETINVQKCLDAGFDFVVVVVSEKKKASVIRSKIVNEGILGLDNKVKVLTLPELLAFLKEILGHESPATTATTPRGSRLSFAQAAELLTVSSSTLYRWIREGRVPFYRLGREYQFDRDELLLIGKHDLSGKRKAVVRLSPLTIEGAAPKGKKQQQDKYRKLLRLD